MPLDSQVRLLRVLESGEMTRVGGEKAIPVDVRVVTATNRSPDEAVDKGTLRQDLYYRLKVFAIDVPPLRDRDDDIELLARHFLQELNREVGEAKRFSDEAVEALVGHHWPGNVRELKNAVHSAFILADDVIEVGDLPPEVASDLPPPLVSGRLEVRPGTSIAEAERRLIMATLDHYDGNRTRAAHSLGISVKTLYNRLKAYAQEDG
jgi:DNA-binding NtrC family response regulator